MLACTSVRTHVTSKEMTKTKQMIREKNSKRSKNIKYVLIFWDFGVWIGDGIALCVSVWVRVELVIELGVSERGNELPLLFFTFMFLVKNYCF